MKSASAATLLNLAAGQTKRIDLYSITLAGGSPTFYFTSHQVPVIVGGQIYRTGLIINRGTVTSVAGLEVQQMPLILSPNPASSAGSILFAGYPLLQAAALRIFDAARVLYSKMFLSDFNDLTPGAVPWYQGEIGDMSLGRLSVEFTVDSDLQSLNVAAPPNVIEKRCRHTLFDNGCGLLASAFQVNGTVASGSTVLNVNTNLTQPDKYFSLGRITFLTGVNATTPSTTYFVKYYQNASGQVQLVRPLANAPQAGDTFVILPGCARTMAACKNTDPALGPPFNNLKRFRGIPFVPVPETLYNGGAAAPATPSAGSDGGLSIGSPFSSNLGQRNVYKP